jgi:hypothetical protein
VGERGGTPVDRGQRGAGGRPAFFGKEGAHAVAAGNAAVFGDVAPPFIRFISLFRDPEVAVPEARATLLRDPWVARNEDLLRALGAYVDALELLRAGDHDPRARAARMVVANASIGTHEQRLVDPFVRAAIPGRWISAIVATSHMGLLIPEGPLALNHDVPPPAYLHGAEFQPELAHLDDADAVALAHRFRQELDSAKRSGAPDWESYDERMGFIFTLLRAYQCDPVLFDLPPGTP